MKERLIVRILSRFRYVIDLKGELRELRHNNELYGKLIDTMTAYRDVLLETISDLKAEKARMEKKEIDREAMSRDLLNKILSIRGTKGK